MVLKVINFDMLIVLKNDVIISFKNIFGGCDFYWIYFIVGIFLKEFDFFYFLFVVVFIFVGDKVRIIFYVNFVFCLCFFCLLVYWYYFKFNIVLI